MPQANSYSQYGFGYDGAAATGAATQTGTAVSQQPGQAQWGADPSAFYGQNYWGGKT